MVVVLGDHGFAPRRQLVDDGDVEVAVDGHGQGAGYGRGGHHQHVRRPDVLGPELGPLRHAEAVLLVDDGEAEVGEYHCVFDQRVGAYQDVDAAGGEVGKQLRADALAGRAGEQLDAHGQPVEHGSYALEVLCGKYFGGRHQAGLEAVVDHHQHHHQRHQRLARAHVALHQTVHLAAGVHVGHYLADHALLRAGGLEGYLFFVERVEQPPNLRHPVAGLPGVARRAGAQYVDVDIEQLFELEAQPRLFELAVVGREVDDAQGVGPAHQPAARADVLRKRLGDAAAHLNEQGGHHLLNRLRVQIALLHPLGGVVERLQRTDGRHLPAHHRLHFGMRHGDAVVELGGLAKEEIVGVGPDGAAHILHPLEPHQLHHARAIGHRGCQTGLAPRAHHIERREARAELDVGHVGPQVGYAVDAAAVHIFVGIIRQQVLARLQMQLGTQQLGPLGTNAGQTTESRLAGVHHGSTSG